MVAKCNQIKWFLPVKHNVYQQFSSNESNYFCRLHLIYVSQILVRDSSIINLESMYIYFHVEVWWGAPTHMWID